MRTTEGTNRHTGSNFESGFDAAFWERQAERSARWLNRSDSRIVPSGFASEISQPAARHAIETLLILAESTASQARSTGSVHTLLFKLGGLCGVIHDSVMMSNPMRKHLRTVLTRAAIRGDVAHQSGVRGGDDYPLAVSRSMRSEWFPTLKEQLQRNG